jgi:hypothetical protein
MAVMNIQGLDLDVKDDVSQQGPILGFLVSALCHLTKCGHWPEQDCVLNKDTNLAADTVHHQ